MRKVRFILFIGLAILGLVSCSKESEIIETPENNQEEYVLSFTGKRPVLGSETRTEWNGSSIVWSSKDKIRIGYTIGGNWQSSGREGDTTPKFYQSNDVAIDSNNPDVGTFTVPISGSAFADQGNEGEYVFYGIYPSTAINNASASSAPTVYVTIPPSQTPGVNTFDKSADLLIGQTEPTDLSELPTDAIGITWSRIVGHGFLTFKDFKNVEDGETITKISLTANTPLAGGFNIDVSSGEYSTPTGSNELTINGTNLSFTQEDSKTNVKAWVCLLPETITSLDVDVETNKAHYTRNITGISTAFKQNAKNNLTINMGSATRTSKTGPLVADGYYVISYDDKMMTVGDVSNNYRGYADKNVANPSDDAIWKIQYVSENDAYTIFSLGAKNNLYGTTGSNTNLTLSSGSNLTNLFTIEKSSSDASTYKISPYNSARSIGYNTSSPRFAAYTGSNNDQPITLDLTSITVDETPLITIAEGERTKSVSASTTTVSFTYTANAFATEVPTVSVTSGSNIINGTPAVADGTITVELNPNTTTASQTATLSVSGVGINEPIVLTINQDAKVGDVFEYLFTSKSWAATRDNDAENWTSGKDGNGLTSGRGIQVTTGVTGANGTSPFAFSDISEVEVTYSTNANAGAGSITVQVGENDAVTENVTKTGGTDDRTITYSFSPKQSGKVKITVICTTNSIYIKSVKITAVSINTPVKYAINVSATSNGSISANKGTAYEGEEITLTATPDEGFKLSSWAVTGVTSGNTVSTSGNTFIMPAEAVSVSATFIEDEATGGEKTVTFTPGTDTGETSVTKDGITVTMTTMNNDSYYQVYANQSMIVSSSSHTIKSISFTCTASGTAKYGPGNASANVGTYSYSESTGTWVGSNASVTISSTAQIRMTSLTITYE